MESSSVFSVLVLVIIFAVLIQFLVDRIKTILGKKVMKHIPADILSVLLGIMFAFMFQIDVFVIFGLYSSVPFVGIIVSGLIVSAGAPAIHELIANIREQRNMIQDISREE